MSVSVGRRPRRRRRRHRNTNPGPACGRQSRCQLSNLPKPPNRRSPMSRRWKLRLRKCRSMPRRRRPRTGPAPAADEADALVMGLTSLMERLSAEEDQSSTSRPAPAPPRHACDTSFDGGDRLPRHHREPWPSPQRPWRRHRPRQPSQRQHRAVEPTAWKQLKELESLEYAMPKNVCLAMKTRSMPAQPAQAQPAPAPEPAPASTSSVRAVGVGRFDGIAQEGSRSVSSLAASLRGLRSTESPVSGTKVLSQFLSTHRKIGSQPAVRN